MGGDAADHRPERGVVIRWRQHSGIYVVRVDLLVVLCRQINSVLVPSGGEISLQTLDLLGVFLQEDEVHVERVSAARVRRWQRGGAGPP